METEMNPFFEVNRTIVNRKPQYEITLSPANLNHLLAGCPDIDRLIGNSPGGNYFNIFASPLLGHMPESFGLMPDGMGWYAYLGWPLQRFPPQTTEAELAKLLQQDYENLERAINESDRIPIEEDFMGRKITLGYVTMKVNNQSAKTL